MARGGKLGKFAPGAQQKTRQQPAAAAPRDAAPQPAAEVAPHCVRPTAPPFPAHWWFAVDAGRVDCRECGGATFNSPGMLVAGRVRFWVSPIGEPLAAAGFSSGPPGWTEVGPDSLDAEMLYYTLGSVIVPHAAGEWTWALASPAELRRCGFETYFCLECGRPGARNEFGALAAPHPLL